MKKILLVSLGWAFLAYEVNAFDIAQGERFEYPDKGLSIVPPQGFEVYENVAGVFLSFREQHRKGLQYQRNIQVFWNNEYHYIDGAAAKKLSEDISAKFSKYNPHISDYRVSRYSIVNLGDREGILFYNNYKIDNSEMMHIVLLVSSSDSHYLITFTDLLKNYNRYEEDEEYSNAWWNCFTSVELNGSPPLRYRYYIIGGGVLGVFLFIGGPLYLLQRRRSSKYYDSFAQNSVEQQEMEEVDDTNSKSGKELPAYDIEDDDDDDYEDEEKNVFTSKS